MLWSDLQPDGKLTLLCEQAGIATSQKIRKRRISSQCQKFSNQQTCSSSLVVVRDIPVDNNNCTLHRSMRGRVSITDVVITGIGMNEQQGWEQQEGVIVSLSRWSGTFYRKGN